MAKHDNKNKTGDSLKTATEKGTASEIAKLTPATHGGEKEADTQPLDRVALEPEVSVGHLPVSPEAPDPSGEIERNPVGDLHREVTPYAAAAEDTAGEQASWPLVEWHGFVAQKIGTPSWVLSGAMAEQDSEASYTESEVRSLVEKFLNTPAR